MCQGMGPFQKVFTRICIQYFVQRQGIFVHLYAFAHSFQDTGKSVINNQLQKTETINRIYHAGSAD